MEVTSSDPLKQIKTQSGEIKPVQTISRNSVNTNNMQKAMMNPNNTQSLAQSSEVKAATDPITTGGKGVKPQLKIWALCKSYLIWQV